MKAMTLCAFGHL